jgi:hypothetical protein
MEHLAEYLKGELERVARARAIAAYRVSSKRNAKGELVVAIIISEQKGTTITAYVHPGGVVSLYPTYPTARGQEVTVELDPGYRVAETLYGNRKLVFGPPPAPGVELAEAVTRGVARVVT